MDKDQFNQKLETLCEELFFQVSAEANRLFQSGAVDVDSFQDDMRLPKIILCAALHNEAEQYRPRDKKLLKELRNLTRF